ncbi:unnamed protein product [Ascophyllum nodosum]
MIITAGSPSEAWKILLSMVGESSEVAQDRAKKESKELTFEIGKESIRDYVARRAKSLVTKLEQNSVSTTKIKINRQILNGLLSVFDVEKKMFSMTADIEPDELGEALARIEDSRTRDGSAGGTQALATGVKPRGNGQRRGSTGQRRPWQCSRQARRQRPSASSSSAAVGFAAPHAVSTAVGFAAPSAVSAAVGFAAPRATAAGAAAAKASAAVTEAAISATEVAVAVIRTPWRVGTIACLFPLRPAGTFLCRMSSDTSCAAKHVSPAPYTAPQGDQQANYSAISPGDYASSLGGEHGQQMPTPPAPHGPPLPSDPLWTSRSTGL